MVAFQIIAITVVIPISHWRHWITECAEFWIHYKRPAFLSNFSCLQLIQNPAPFVTRWRQCDIWIRSFSYCVCSLMLRTAVKNVVDKSNSMGKNSSNAFQWKKKRCSNYLSTSSIKLCMKEKLNNTILQYIFLFACLCQ